MAENSAQIAVSTGVDGTKMYGIGAYRPERVVDNEEICQHIDSSDEWIQERSGIKTRRFATREEWFMAVHNQLNTTCEKIIFELSNEFF